MFFSSDEIDQKLIQFFRLKGLNQKYIKTKVDSDFGEQKQLSKNVSIGCMTMFHHYREMFRIDLSQWMRIGFNTLHLRPFQTIFCSMLKPFF